jgi:oligopeptidase A
MQRFLRASKVKRVSNYGLLRRSISSARQTPAVLKPLVPKRPLAMAVQAKSISLLSTSFRGFATIVKDYQQTPYLKWNLFPDFEHLVTQTKPSIAVPAFQKLISAAKDQFLEIEKNFEPTWDGTIGQCKSRFMYTILY